MEDLADIAEGSFEIQKEEWERVRESIYWGFLPNAKKPKQLKKTDIMKFPWDHKRKPMGEEKKKELIDHGARLVDIVKRGLIIPKQKKPELK